MRGSNLRLIGMMHLILQEGARLGRDVPHKTYKLCPISIYIG